MARIMSQSILSPLDSWTRRSTTGSAIAGNRVWLAVGGMAGAGCCAGTRCGGATSGAGFRFPVLAGEVPTLARISARLRGRTGSCGVLAPGTGALAAAGGWFCLTASAVPTVISWANASSASSQQAMAKVGRREPGGRVRPGALDGAVGFMGVPLAVGGAVPR